MDRLLFLPEMSDDAAIPSPGRITIESHGDLRIVSFHGEHDLSTRDLARERLSDARVWAGVIIVDLTAATFIDSSIVGALHSACRADTPPRMRVVAVAGSEPRRLFDLVGFDEVVPIYECLDDAIR